VKTKFSKILNFIKKNKYKFIIGIIVLVIGGLIGSNKYKKAQEEKPVFQKPQREDIIKTLDIPGVIDAKEKASMRFAGGGKVVYLGAKEGDFVKKYQTIATIDKRDLNKQLQDNLNDYMKERWDWEQQLDDVEDRTIDQAEERTVDKNQWDLENSVIAVERNQISITDTVMSSPITGILVSSPTNVTGVNLIYTETFEIINPDSLIIKAYVDEADMALVKKSQEAMIELDAYPNETITSFVDFIAFKSTQTTSGTSFVVELPINSNDINKFRLGMNGDVEIIMQTKNNVLTIPLVATIEKDGKTYVEVKKGKDTEEVEIEVGLETDELIEVISGLDENDEVLIPE
jgi:RND family efflux transporter MFP subunit